MEIQWSGYFYHFQDEMMPITLNMMRRRIISRFDLNTIWILPQREDLFVNVAFVIIKLICLFKPFVIPFPLASVDICLYYLFIIINLSHTSCWSCVCPTKVLLPLALQNVSNLSYASNSRVSKLNLLTLYTNGIWVVDSFAQVGR